MSRFEDVNDDYLNDLLRTYDSKSTTLCIKSAIGLFSKFVKSKNIHDKVEELPLADLNIQLKLFFGSIKREDGNFSQKCDIKNV